MNCRLQYVKYQRDDQCRLCVYVSNDLMRPRACCLFREHTVSGPQAQTGARVAPIFSGQSESIHLGLMSPLQRLFSVLLILRPLPFRAGNIKNYNCEFQFISSRFMACLRQAVHGWNEGFEWIAFVFVFHLFMLYRSTTCFNICIFPI